MNKKRSIVGFFVTKDTDESSATCQLCSVTILRRKLSDRRYSTSTNPHPTDFAHEIRIRRMRILAGSITSLAAYMFYYCEHGGVDLMGLKPNL